MRSGQCSLEHAQCILGLSGAWQKWCLRKQTHFITGGREKSKYGVQRGEKESKYREEKLRLPGWDPERENYSNWRFLVDKWTEGCDRAKLSRADR